MRQERTSPLPPTGPCRALPIARILPAKKSGFPSPSAAKRYAGVGQRVPSGKQANRTDGHNAARQADAPSTIRFSLAQNTQSYLTYKLRRYSTTSSPNCGALLCTGKK